MAQYLHIRVEDVDLLLPALQVHEVIGLTPEDLQTEGHAMWRDQVIAARDLGQVLKRCTSPAVREFGVVYSPDNSDAPPVLMAIDSVLGLRTPRQEQLHRLPGLKTGAHDLFEAIWMDTQSGLKAYCVKPQLAENWLG